MDSNFRRSFKGYDPVSVANELSIMDQEFTHKRDELRKTLETRVQQKQILKEEINKLNQELAPLMSIQDKISSRLVSAHIKASETVINAIKEMEEFEQVLTNMISERKDELNRFYLAKEKMSKDFIQTATRYGNMVSWRKEGEINVKD